MPRKKHGHARKGSLTKEFVCWLNMRRRCYYQKHHRHSDYGGRGIAVCERWRNSFGNFLADMGPKPSPRHTLERIDNDGNYEPGNCRWATPKEQSNNTRRNRTLTLNGRAMHLHQWAKELGIGRRTIAARIDVYGWTVEQALTTPAGPRFGSLS